MSDPDNKSLQDLPPLRDIITRYDLRADKKLGQNFLLDANITDKIVRVAGDLSGKTVFEIGPGPGGLTRSLLATQARNVIAIEYDSRAIAALEELKKSTGKDRLHILNADALNTNLLALSPKNGRVVVANLPYNIATPLLTGWLRQIRETKNSYDSMILMFQREVAERLCAKPGNKAYGRLSILAQWLCRVEKQFDLPPAAFTPPPKVTSSVVRFIPKELPSDAPAFCAVEKITAAAFGQRRKMIRSSLKPHLEKLEPLHLDTTVRAEQIPVETYIEMAKRIGA